jgi:hypothetical protein
MIIHEHRQRPTSWGLLRSRVRQRWIIPFVAFEWVWQWAAYLLSRWSFLEVLEYLSSFSVLVAVIFYFSGSGDRTRQRHYQAWQVINTAQGKGGSGGRIEALQELNAANLLRSDFSAADVRGSDLRSADFTSADLHSANFRNSDLSGASFQSADMHDADLWGSNLTGVRFSDADMGGADLRFSDLLNSDWKQIRNIKMANIAGVKNAPDGFIDWAMKNGAIRTTSQDN